MEKKSIISTTMSRILCLVLIAAMALTMTACSNTGAGTSSVSSAGSPDIATVLGEGDTSFSLTVADADGKETYFVINTDEKTVGAALLKLDLISGDESQYGLYVKKVNGITADYDADGTYWAFYIDGEYASTGVDSTDITDGASYALRVSK
ncbi:MAG: DUF4430 domain-containing protein [Firmicutes bacterium]|nr:DUF4430 domain-containing protein [Bacillota bacterium]